MTDGSMADLSARRNSESGRERERYGTPLGHEGMDTLTWISGLERFRFGEEYYTMPLAANLVTAGGGEPFRSVTVDGKEAAFTIWDEHGTPRSHRRRSWTKRGTSGFSVRRQGFRTVDRDDAWGQGAQGAGLAASAPGVPGGALTWDRVFGPIRATPPARCTGR